ncbi:hypothetical protein WME76_02225 [Sorangium sp. So ce119]|uniref:hypothetical protein n=1 Tax=Sorangium sp. So ce119 TaxID=3133279 RepID=UPI003F5FB87B
MSSPLRAFLRRFREAMGKADISLWPITVRLDQPDPARPEPRIVRGHVSVPREPLATSTHAFENSPSHKCQW